MTAEAPDGGGPPQVRPDNRCPVSVKVDLVLRLLRGETLADLSRETGRPRKQLSAWRQRFLAGGEAYLDGRFDPDETDALRAARDELAARVAELESENRMLSRRAALLARNRSTRTTTPHPNCSEAYARALDEPGLRLLFVPEWGTYVVVREAHAGVRQATGVRPYASLDPDCDVRGGLEMLRKEGIVSVSLITDPMWCPDVPVLQEAFAICREFKESYFVDREVGSLHIRKRHRNAINRARRLGEVREVDLADHVGRWLELYERNVADRQIAQPFGSTYFERLPGVPGLRTVAVLVEGEIASMTLWVRHDDVLYYYDGASSEAGFAAGASYAAFAHVIENTPDCRYLFFGGSSGIRDEWRDGLAVFKRGFSNASAMSYLCSATLNRPARRAAGS